MSGELKAETDVIIASMETCKVTYTWTKSELLKALRHHDQSQLRPSFVMAINVMAVLLAALSIFIPVSNGSNSSTIIPAILFSTCAIYWLFLRRLINDWRWTHGFDKAPAVNEVARWEFSADQIAYECVEVVSFKAEWKVLSKVAEASNGFLLYTYPKNMFYWLPLAGFETPQSIEIFKSIVQSKQIRHIKLKSQQTLGQLTRSNATRF